MIKVDGGALLSNTASNCGVWFFDETEKTISQIATTGHEWYMVKWHDSVLLGSFNSSVYGWYFYKNGVITYNAGFNSNTRCMRCISVVEDGWVVSSYNYSSPVAFIDGDTGEAKNLGISVNQVGPYMPNWYGPNTSWKPTYDYNRKFGRYRVLSSYDGNGCIFDDIAHEVLPLVYWYNGSELPSTTTAKSTSLRRVAFIELDNNTVLIVSGYSSNSNCVTLNYSTGTAYLWQNLSLYVNNEANYWFTPLDEEIPVSDGLLIYIKPFDYSEYPAMLTSAAGVWHYYPTTGRLDRIYSSGYYDTKEDAPGGFYLYLSSLPQINRLYWNDETHTLTKIDY